MMTITRTASERLAPPTVLVHASAEIRAAVLAARAAGKTIGLVPTMGALHEGHLSLVRESTDSCSCTVVSIFVNPTQFAPHEDFARYPRSLEGDLAALRQLGVDYVFAPSQDEIYPPGFSTCVDPPAVATPLEGICRPGHFRGVATVVLKLFHLVPADVAYFGQKDYQQSLVVRRMVEDLNLPVAIRVLPIVREADGLALSSRNRYLDSAQREQAVALSRSLRIARELAAAGERDTAVIRARMRRELEQVGISRIDYVSIVDPETLAELTVLEGPAMALVAAYVGATRLIDNDRLGF